MNRLRPGQSVIIHYAAANRVPDPRWRDRPGIVLAVGRGPGPRNVLVETEIGRVVVPQGNVRLIRPRTGEILNFTGRDMKSVG